ncbi:uncharacterized protein BYT42DRAFT_583619, partial [Radiomyces spectabilis]|uniref:uncharacterized protein n=1 Tax=Radiomyces spectabilis TaxID=64574 RepID=UPI0022212361
MVYPACICNRSSRLNIKKVPFLFLSIFFSLWQAIHPPSISTLFAHQMWPIRFLSSKGIVGGLTLLLHQKVLTLPPQLGFTWIISR